MRWVSTRVLPLPAPARISSGPSPWVTASRWGSFRPSSSSCSMLGVRVLHRPSSIDAGSAARPGGRAPPRSAISASCASSATQPPRAAPATLSPRPRSAPGGILARDRRSGRDLRGRLLRHAVAAVSSPTARSSAPMRLGQPPAIASAIGSGRWIQSASGPSGRRPSTRTGWPGLPTTVEFGGTSVITTLLAPIFAPWPIVIGPEQLRARADRHVVLHGRMALAGGEAGAPERDALVDRHVTRRCSAVSPITTPEP